MPTESDLPKPVSLFRLLELARTEPAPIPKDGFHDERMIALSRGFIEEYNPLLEDMERRGREAAKRGLYGPPKRSRPKPDPLDTHFRLTLKGRGALAEWRMQGDGQDDAKRPNEMTLAEAYREFCDSGASKSAWTRAAQKKPDEPGYLPHRRFGRHVLVTRKHAKLFATNYDARREQRTVGSKSDETSRETVARPKCPANSFKNLPRRNRR